MAVAFDTKTSATADDVTTVSWSHTTSGSDRLLIVNVYHRTTITSITYNGVGLTEIGTINNADLGAKASMWRLINPASGSNTIQVNSSGGIFGEGVGISFTGVDQATPLGTHQKAGSYGSPATITVIGVTDGMIIDAMTTGGGTITVGGGQTERHNVNYWNRHGASTSIETGSVAMDWTFSDDYWAIIAVPVNPSVALLLYASPLYRPIGVDRRMI